MKYLEKKKNAEIVKKISQWKVTTQIAIRVIFSGWPYCFAKKYIQIIGIFWL